MSKAKRVRIREPREWSTERETDGLLKNDEQIEEPADQADGEDCQSSRQRRPPTAKFRTPKEKSTPIQPVYDYQATSSKQRSKQRQEKKQGRSQQGQQQTLSPSHHHRRQAKEQTAITLDDEDNSKNDKTVVKKEPTKPLPPMQSDTGVIFISNRPASLQLFSNKPQIYSHFKLACFAMLCCCCPIGFMALINSCKAIRYNRRGDDISASKYSLLAKRRAQQSFKVCGFLWICLIVLLIAASFIVILVIHPAIISQ